MALTILNNIAALAAENQLNITNSSLNSTLEQLSSGSRINSGADDPAGLAIANGLQANISALTQSASNATDGVGELQVADGALSQVTTLLDRAVTLATESATGTVSDSQRTALDAEYQSIKAEIDSIGSTTNYNGGQVFNTNTLNIFLSDGSTSGSSSIGVTTGTLSANGLNLGGAVAATGTLSQAAGASATAATDTLTGANFTEGAAGSNTITYLNADNPANNDTATIDQPHWGCEPGSDWWLYRSIGCKSGSRSQRHVGWRRSCLFSRPNRQCQRQRNSERGRYHSDCKRKRDRRKRVYHRQQHNRHHTR
jgi:flagellin